MTMTKAERMKAHRARKREGVTCIAHVQIYEADVATLVERGWLRPEDADDVARISEAVEGLVDDFTEGHGAEAALPATRIAATTARKQPALGAGQPFEPGQPGSPGSTPTPTEAGHVRAVTLRRSSGAAYPPLPES